MRILQAEREIKINQVAQIAEALSLYPHEIIESAELILARSVRGKTTLADVTPLRGTDVTGVDDTAQEDQRAVASDRSEDDGEDGDYDA